MCFFTIVFVYSVCVLSSIYLSSVIGDVIVSCAVAVGMEVDRDRDREMPEVEYGPAADITSFTRRLRSNTNTNTNNGSS